MTARESPKHYYRLQFKGGQVLVPGASVPLAGFSGPPCIWAKWGRFVIFPVLCLLAYGETASQVLGFTSIWGTQ